MVSQRNSSFLDSKGTWLQNFIETVPQALIPLCTSSSRDLLTRPIIPGIAKISKYLYRTEFAKKTLLCRSQIWNDTPVEIRELLTMDHSQNSLKRI